MTPQENTTPDAKMNRIRDRLLEFLEWVRLETAKFFRVGRMKYDTTALQRERAAVYQDLGKRSCELVKQDRLNAEDLKILVERIDALTLRIEEQRASIEELMRSRNDTKVATKQD